MTTYTWTQPQRGGAGAQELAAWTGNVESGLAIHHRLAGPFNVHAKSTPNMTVEVAGGTIPSVGGGHTEIAAQTTATLSAPSSNPRHDIVYIDAADGTVGVATGTEAASPSDPSIPTGKVAIARLSMTVGMSSITASAIEDLRALQFLGLPDATTAEMEAGTETALRAMSPADVAAAIGALASSADQTARNNIAILAFRLAAANSLTIQQMVDGVVDEFEDQTGVDGAASTGETYNASGNYYHNPQTSGSTDVLTGGVVVQSTQDGSNPGSNVADDNTSTYWASTAASPGPHWVYYDLGGSPVACNKANITVFKDGGGFGLKDYVIQGSNDTSNWTTLFTRTGLADGGDSYVETATWSNLTPYRYYRLHVSGSYRTNNQAVIREWEMFESVDSPNMDLISEPVTADAQPDTMHLVLLWENVDGVTVLNLGLTIEGTRDGGTSWTFGTLVDEGMYDTGIQVVTADVDVSGQPAGTSLAWRLKTNKDEHRIHGVAMSWR